MKVSTEHIRELRDQAVTMRRHNNYVRKKVIERNETMIAIFNEVLEYREAEEQSEIDPTAAMLCNEAVRSLYSAEEPKVYFTEEFKKSLARALPFVEIPVKGTVS